MAVKSETIFVLTLAAATVFALPLIVYSEMPGTDRTRLSMNSEPSQVSAPASAQIKAASEIYAEEAGLRYFHSNGSRAHAIQAVAMAFDDIDFSNMSMVEKEKRLSMEGLSSKEVYTVDYLVLFMDGMKPSENIYSNECTVEAGTVKGQIVVRDVSPAVDRSAVSVANWDETLGSLSQASCERMLEDGTFANFKAAALANVADGDQPSRSGFAE